MTDPVVVHHDVLAALRAGQPVVALESTIFSNLGLPSPANAEALDRCIGAISATGGTTVVTAVLDGVLRVGLDPAEYPRILGAARKVAERELAVAGALRWEFGATTVSASLALAAQAGVRVFATGGIGGVHIGAETTDDVSADLTAIARHQVITVCAGPKSFLDIPRTVERLETLGVPVIGVGTDHVPGFYARSSGVRVPVRVDDPADIARIATLHWRLGHGGLLVTVPIPDEAAIADAEVWGARDDALAEAAAAGISGAAVTPFVLARIAAVTEGRSIPANLALAENNARLAVAIAAHLVSR